MRVSDSLPLETSTPEGWAEFLAGLTHGPEITRLRTYIVTFSEVQEICGSRALGCYGRDEMVAPGELVADISPEEVVRHEYGHHVANHRLNAPWAAIDWGPKRWASAANVCANVSRREAFPGDQGSNYARNPGEAWAEVYRLMDERKAGITTATLADHRPELLPERGRVAGGGAGRAPPVDCSEHAGRNEGLRQEDRKGLVDTARDAARRRLPDQRHGAEQRDARRRARRRGSANRRQARAVGRAARQAPGQLDLRPALALRPRHAGRCARARSCLGDDAVIRVLAVVVALAATVLATGASAVTGTTTVRNVTAEDIPTLQSTARSVAQTAWCGTGAQADRAPNGVAGNPIHWVYVIPSDGADNLSGLASVMQSDAEQIDGWWRGQDPTRTPRNDVAPFSCGAQLDVTTVRTQQSSAQLAPLQGRFSGIVSALDQAGLSSSTTKYVVYYDGPTADGNVCGQGGSDSSGFGAAVVYYRACVGVSTAAVTAHEVLHTFGAVSSAAPNECDGETSGHTCDDEARPHVPVDRR